MISRENRFHGYNSLRTVYTRGKSVRGPWIAVKFSPNPRRSSYRAAVVVSRKVHKSAVVRNRIRRRLYEIVRRHEAGIAQPVDIVITVFDDHIANIPAPQLEIALLDLFHQARIIAKPTK